MRFIHSILETFENVFLFICALIIGVLSSYYVFINKEILANFELNIDTFGHVFKNPEIYLKVMLLSLVSFIVCLIIGGVIIRFALRRYDYYGIIRILIGIVGIFTICFGMYVSSYFVNILVMFMLIMVAIYFVVRVFSEQ